MYCEGNSRSSVSTAKDEMAQPPATEAMHDAALDETHKALNDITEATADHEQDPKDHLHKAADHETAHSWIGRWLPSWEYIRSMESSYHLGNWVRDRHTNEKTWESMSIYVS